MDYFFIDPEDIHDRIALISGEEFNHLSRVLRKKEGERVTLLDGEDHFYEAVVRSIEKAHAECEILEVKYRVNEPKIDVTLAVSLLRNTSRFEFLVEKATELGVRSIVPLLCERTIRKSEKQPRLKKIALSAMKQCGRSYLPRIHELASFQSVLDRSPEFGLRLLPHERTEQSQFIGPVLQHHPKVSSVLIAIGPEGGFSERELALAIEKGFVPISLGARRLRTETAAISAVSWVVGGW
jgi:16S rRNA (uracil1498-N3)-methyltransferase